MGENNEFYNGYFSNLLFLCTDNANILV